MIKDGFQDGWLCSYAHSQGSGSCHRQKHCFWRQARFSKFKPETKVLRKTGNKCFSNRKSAAEKATVSYWNLWKQRSPADLESNERESSEVFMYRAWLEMHKHGLIWSPNVSLLLMPVQWQCSPVKQGDHSSQLAQHRDNLFLLHARLKKTDMPFDRL